MTKYGYVALRLNDGNIDLLKAGFKYAEGKIDLPMGCIGFMLCFRTKKLAYDWYGKNVVLQKFEYKEVV